MQTAKEMKERGKSGGEEEEREGKKTQSRTTSIDVRGREGCEGELGADEVDGERVTEVDQRRRALFAHFKPRLSTSATRPSLLLPL